MNQESNLKKNVSDQIASACFMTNSYNFHQSESESDYFTGDTSIDHSFTRVTIAMTSLQISQVM